MYKGEKKNYKILGICMACIQMENVRDIAMSISIEARRRGYNVFLFNAFNDMFNDTPFTRGEASIYRLANAEMLDALVVLPESIKDDGLCRRIVSEAKKAGLPVICVDKTTADCPSIVFDYADAFEKIVRHIVEDHGCRKINFIAGMKDNEFSDERIACYKKVLEENGIEFEEERFGYGDFWNYPARVVLENFLESGLSMPEAIICCNDDMAIEVCRTLRRHGYKVPQDVIVTGFDGVDLEKYITPRLTTAAANIEALGGVAIDLLEDIIAGKNTENIIEIPFKVRISQSCGCEKIPADFGGDKIMELYDKISTSDGHEKHMFWYLHHSVECTTFDEFVSVMSKYADCYSWCCLNTDFISDVSEESRYHDVYTENMVTIMRSEKDDFQTDMVYPANQILPDIEYALEHHSIMMFVPLHFQEEVMGYMAVAVNRDDFSFLNTQRFINNTNQIFENLKNRIKLQRAYAEMAEMHVRDPLTGIFNRRGFYKKASELMDKYGNTKEYALFSADLDGLKIINDTYGHDMGDKAIKSAAEALCAAGGLCSVCARFGGDEFIVLAAADNADEFIDQFNVELEKMLDKINGVGDIPFKVSLSCGAAKPEDLTSEGIDAIIKLADTNMYEFKRRKHALGRTV